MEAQQQLQVVTQPQRTLVKKLSEVMGEVERVAKNGRNVSQNYQYATEADIAAAVREAMAKRYLLLIPSVQKMEWGEVQTNSGKPLKLCTLTVEFTLEDGESGETRKYIIIGQGTDNGDKATYKAMTGAEKYALMKLFLIPTGDDPEKDEAPAQQAQAPHQQARPDGADDVTPEGAYGPVITWGKDKGRRASELSRKDLAFHVQATRKSLANPAKSKWKQDNETKLSQLLAVAESKGWATKGADHE